MTLQATTSLFAGIKESPHTVIAPLHSADSKVRTGQLKANTLHWPQQAAVFVSHFGVILYRPFGGSSNLIKKGKS